MAEQKIMYYIERTCTPGTGQSFYNVCEYGLGDYYKHRTLGSTALHNLKRLEKFCYDNKIWYVPKKVSTQ